jgi:hypothetical protein
MRRFWNRLKIRWRQSGLAQWMAEQEDVLWASIIEPTAAAIDAGPPKLADYKGLRGLTAITSHTGANPQWQLVWNNEWAADRSELRFARQYGNGAATRIAIHYIELPKQKWWTKPVPITLTFAALGTVATAIANVESLRNFATELTHTPTLTLETTEPLRAASNAYDPKEIEVRGDPYFNSRISGITMTVVPDPAFPGTAPLKGDWKIVLPGSIRALNTSEKATLYIPLKKLPAGRYLIKLKGSVHTAAFSTGDFSPDDIKLEVRPPMRSFIRQLTPWPAEEAAKVGTATQALLDLRFEFGRVPDSTSTLSVVIPGKWTHWEPDPLPLGQSIEHQSINTDKRPNSAVFLLKDVPSTNFGTQSIRIHLYSQTSLTTEQWQQATAGYYADLM